MDRTTICLGTEARNALREFKHDNDLPHYDAAIRTLLVEGGASETLSIDA